MAGKSPEDEHPIKTFGWAATDTTGVLSPFKFSRRFFFFLFFPPPTIYSFLFWMNFLIWKLFFFFFRATGDEDVRLKVLYCGICHTDLHHAKNDWGVSFYPFVPGYPFYIFRFLTYHIYVYIYIKSTKRNFNLS